MAMTRIACTFEWLEMLTRINMGGRAVKIIALKTFKTDVGAGVRKMVTMGCV